MSSTYEILKTQIKQSPKTWLITGVAGFIGSNLAETLLKLDQTVIGLDNFSTGKKSNLKDFESKLTPEQNKNFHFIEGDILDLSLCQKICHNIDYVLHQAALGSVPRSLEDPITTNQVNISGTLNMLVAARDQKIKRFVYAASSSTYGDHPDLPKVEEKIGKPLSPYAITKYVNELYADVFSKSYDLQTIGLRYFNVFGKRQDPNGAYAAVIPKWIAAMIKNQKVTIYGNGTTSRDFCYVENAVQSNLLAALTTNSNAINTVYNVAVGQQTSLNELFELLRTKLSPYFPHLQDFKPSYSDFRRGDILHSLANINKAKKLLGYSDPINISDGIDNALEWYMENLTD